MKFDKEELFSNISQFKEFKSAVIDSSSIIYMNRAGYLNIVTAFVKLYAPDAVFYETGIRPEGIEIITFADERDMSADELVLKYGYNLSIPVISDDRGVLKKAEALGLSYYNSLMMLCFLLFQRAINQEEYRIYYDRLKTFARYSSFIYEYEAALKLEILKLHPAGEKKE